ncbi:hypothetical protein E5288_WYG009285 [Bos mutus]|uniref:Uncharacterized protein n=1 Tax=Bos mutus TaxID=72004 RepID=A0A6B0S560_9CETA|nr:hypothetical protein [Bos mutus]
MDVGQPEWRGRALCSRCRVPVSHKSVKEVSLQCTDFLNLSQCINQSLSVFTARTRFHFLVHETKSLHWQYILFHDQILPKVLCNQNKLFKYEVYFCFHHDSESKMIKLLEELNRINKKSGTIIICSYISLNNPFGILLVSEDICYKYYFLYVQVIFKHLLKLLVDQYQMLANSMFGKSPRLVQLFWKIDKAPQRNLGSYLTRHNVTLNKGEDVNNDETENGCF